MRRGLVTAAAVLASSGIVLAQGGSSNCVDYGSCVALVSRSILDDPQCLPATRVQTEVEVRACIARIKEMLQTANAPKGVQEGVKSVQHDVVRELLGIAAGTETGRSNIDPLLNVFVLDLDGQCTSLVGTVKPAFERDILQRCLRVNAQSSLLVRAPVTVGEIEVLRAEGGSWERISPDQPGVYRVEGRPGERIEVRVPCFRLKGGEASRSGSFPAVDADQPAAIDLTSALEPRLTLRFVRHPDDKLEQIQYAGTAPEDLPAGTVESLVACYPDLDADIAAGKRITVALFGSGPSFSSQPFIKQEIELAANVQEHEFDLVGDRLPVLVDPQISATQADEVRKALLRKFPRLIGATLRLEPASSTPGSIPQYRNSIQAPSAFGILLLRGTGTSNVVLLLVYHAFPIPDEERRKELEEVAYDKVDGSHALADLARELSVVPPPLVERDLGLALVDMEDDIATPAPPAGSAPGTLRIRRSSPSRPYQVGDVVEYVYASMDPEQASLSRIRALQQGETPVRLVQYKNRDGEQKQENLAEHRWTENLVMLDAASVIELSSSREGLMFALWRAVDDGATPAARCAALLNLASLHESYIEQSALVESSFRRWDDLDRVCGNGREAKLQKDEIQGRREKYAKP